MVGESIGLRLGQFAVQLRPPIVGLPRPAGENLLLALRRGENLFVGEAGTDRLQAGKVEIRERDSRVVALGEHHLRRGDAGPPSQRHGKEILGDDHVDEVLRGPGARHRAPRFRETRARRPVHAAARRDDQIGAAQHEDARQLGHEQLGADEEPDAPERRVHRHQLVAGNDVLATSHQVGVEDGMVGLDAMIGGADLAPVVDEEVGDAEGTLDLAAVEPSRAHPDLACSRPLLQGGDGVVLHRSRVRSGIALGEDHVARARVRRLVDERARLQGVAMLLGSREGRGLDGGDAKDLSNAHPGHP